MSWFNLDVKNIRENSLPVGSPVKDASQLLSCHAPRGAPTHGSLPGVLHHCALFLLPFGRRGPSIFHVVFWILFIPWLCNAPSSLTLLKPNTDSTLRSMTPSPGRFPWPSWRLAKVCPSPESLLRSLNALSTRGFLQKLTPVASDLRKRIRKHLWSIMFS